MDTPVIGACITCSRMIIFANDFSRITGRAISRNPPTNSFFVIVVCDKCSNAHSTLPMNVYIGRDIVKQWNCLTRAKACVDGVMMTRRNEEGPLRILTTDVLVGETGHFNYVRSISKEGLVTEDLDSNFFKKHHGLRGLRAPSTPSFGYWYPCR